MDNRVKERLTGAIILVAALVILVPEMFSGHHGSNEPVPVNAPPRPATEGPPLRTYTMERDATAPGADKPVTSAKPSPAQPSVAAASQASQASQARQAAVPEPAVTQSRRAVEESPAQAPPAGEERFYVQVGSFSKADNAQRFAQEISRKGFAARVDKGKGELLRVRVGPVTGRSAALDLKAQLATQGYKGALTGP